MPPRAAFTTPSSRIQVPHNLSDELLHVFMQENINRIPQRRPVRMFPLPKALVGNDELTR